MLFQLKNTLSSMSGTNSLVLTFNNNVTYIVHTVILQVQNVILLDGENNEKSTSNKLIIESLVIQIYMNITQKNCYSSFEIDVT